MSVVVAIDNKRYGGWEAVKITRSLEHASASFAMQVSERYPNEGQHLVLRPGMAVRIYDVEDDSEDLLITGLIDKVSLSYDGTTHTRTISGRSLTGKVIDSSVVHPTGQFKGQTIERIATALCAPYGIKVVMDADSGGTIDYFQVENGEKVFDALERLAWMRKLIVTDTPKGEIMLSNVTDETADTIIQCVYGGSENNVKAGSGSFDNSQRYEKIIVRGQAKGSDDFFGEQANQIEAVAYDTLKNGKVLIKSLSGEGGLADCKAQAEWEVAARKGKSTELDYTLTGWRQGNGDLWACMMVVVKDDFLNVDEKLLITQVEYSLDNQGTKVTLRVQPKEALEPEPNASKKKKGQEGGVGVWDSVRRDVRGK